MSSKAHISKELNAKILYKNPLILIDYKKTGGGVKIDYERKAKNILGDYAIVEELPSEGKVIYHTNSLPKNIKGWNIVKYYKPRNKQMYFILVNKI